MKKETLGLVTPLETFTKLSAEIHLRTKVVPRIFIRP